VIGEVAALTPGPYLHIGGDEALRMPTADYVEVVRQAQAVVAAHGKTAVGWHELSGVDRATVLQFWGNTPWVREVVAAVRDGAGVIMSPADRTYLDQRYTWRGRPGRVWAGPLSGERAYSWDPVSYQPGVPEEAVLGVEAPLWTEAVATVDEVDQLVFPRLTAIAEIGWSPRASRDWRSFRHRLGAQAPRWEALGVNFARAPGVPWVVPSVPIPRPRGGGEETLDRVASPRTGRT
jgi:hexosaminidase